MAFAAQNETPEAVLFSDGHGIIKEMMYTEFEAVLDSYVGLEDFADQEVKAAYVQINKYLKVSRVVLFLISFDDDGLAARDWNVPLRSLAADASSGPDLGGGPIRLACRSHCTAKWHQEALWDPEMRPGRNDLVDIQEAITRNKLSLSYEEEPVEEPPVLQAAAVVSVQQATAPAVDSAKLEQEITARVEKKFEQARRTKLARLLKQQRLRIATLNTKRKDEVELLIRAHRLELQAHEQESDTVRQELEQMRVVNARLNQQIKDLTEDYQNSTTALESKLASLETDERYNADSIKRQYEYEMASKIDAATTELNERLEQRNVELYYKKESERRLKEQLEDVRQEKSELLKEDAEGFLTRVSKAGIVFVAFHPGAGHINISLDDIPVYLDNSTDYVAKKCYVSEEHYIAWLKHYDEPKCHYETEGGPCGVRLEKVEMPAQFKPGESDCCPKHRS